MNKAPKLLDFAEGQDCTFRIPSVCNFDPETTVACHGPDYSRNPRGKAMKCPDFFIAFGCDRCHSALDLMQVDERHRYWLQGILETQKILVEAGLIQITTKTPRPKQLSKVASGKSELARRRTG